MHQGLTPRVYLAMSAENVCVAHKARNPDVAGCHPFRLPGGSCLTAIWSFLVSNASPSQLCGLNTCRAPTAAVVDVRFWI